MLTAVVLAALLIAPSLFVLSTMRVGPFAGRAIRYPAVLVPPSGAYLGAYVAPRSDGDPREAVTALEARIGRPLAIDHLYYRWDQAIPTAAEAWDAAVGRLPFINWSVRRSDGTAVPWRSIANGSQDAWIIDRADALKTFGSPLYLAFDHEPEADLGTSGTASEYAAAFRHIVTVFRSRGVTNVGFVWDMMTWTFDPRSGRDPDAFYPGDDYVDFIGLDGYDWYPDKPDAPWESFHDIFGDGNNFAFEHHKPWIAAETGALEDPDRPDRKAEWLRDIAATAKTWPLLKAVVYFDTVKDGFDWRTNSSVASDRGFAELANDVHMSVIPDATSQAPLANDLDAGPRGAPVVAHGAGAGDPFDAVVTTAGSTLAYDDRHAEGSFSARHDVTAGGNAYYAWTGYRSMWIGRLLVWLEGAPPESLRLVRGATDGLLRCALDIMPDRTLRWVDQHNDTIASTDTPIPRHGWVEIGWKVDHSTGMVTITLFGGADGASMQERVSSRPHRAIGPSINEVDIGRSGSLPFASTFWTDDPRLSSGPPIDGT